MLIFQAEKAKQFLYQAKYGRLGLNDPLAALQRDSEVRKVPVNGLLIGTYYMLTFVFKLSDMRIK